MLFVQQIQWQRPPEGTLQRGVLWLRSPLWVGAAILLVVVVVLAVALRKRFRARNADAQVHGSKRQ